MGKFLDTTGQPSLAIGICARCSIKMPIGMLRRDGNTPGLLVCERDWDSLDPYRLAPRQPDTIGLPFVRPETPLYTNPLGVIAEDGDYFVTTEDGEEYLKP